MELPRLALRRSDPIARRRRAARHGVRAGDAAIAVPFAVVGLTLTALRLRDAGFAPIVAFFFLVPFANIAVILLACAAPRREVGPATPPPPEIPRAPVEAVIASLPRPSSVVLVAASFAGAFAMFLGGASAIFVHAFGFAVFFLAPALGGAVASALVGLDGCGGAGRGLLAATLVPLWFAIAIVLIGFDGLVCVLMATPLNGHLASRRGEFLLEALPDGRTRLVGTTWYEVRMWPQLWWGGLSDAIIHRIHRRVLEHVRDGAVAATAPGADRARDRRDRTRASPPR